MGKFDRFFANEPGPAIKQRSSRNDGDVRGLPDGAWVSRGVYRVDHSYRLGDMYGDFPLSAPEAMDVMRRVGARGSVVFIDLETTGLSGGSGIYAFLCGLGSVRGEFFDVTQYFLKSPAYEAEWLLAIDSGIPSGSTIATYNGLSFDVPMLLTRHVMTRTNAHWESSPHIDLLRFSRRFYRGYLASCSLGEVERRVLGMYRGGEDVPGYLIPELYLKYLRSRDASTLGAVFYHNRLDIASLA
ncbi:MAG: ribonuclease H-like domain-containing protein, partial [Synergistaceae bacterium]|nr:ribonuclease H-like domain-containing protein [Synergistaceae bacterium]